MHVGRVEEDAVSEAITTLVTVLDERGDAGDPDVVALFSVPGDDVLSDAVESIH